MLGDMLNLARKNAATKRTQEDIETKGTPFFTESFIRFASFRRSFAPGSGAGFNSKSMVWRSGGGVDGRGKWLRIRAENHF